MSTTKVLEISRQTEKTLSNSTSGALSLISVPTARTVSTAILNELQYTIDSPDGQQHPDDVSYYTKFRLNEKPLVECIETQSQLEFLLQVIQYGLHCKEQNLSVIRKCVGLYNIWLKRILTDDETECSSCPAVIELCKGKMLRMIVDDLLMIFTPFISTQMTAQCLNAPSDSKKQQSEAGMSHLTSEGFKIQLRLCQSVLNVITSCCLQQLPDLNYWNHVLDFLLTIVNITITCYQDASASSKLLITLASGSLLPVWLQCCIHSYPSSAYWQVLSEFFFTWRHCVEFVERWSDTTCCLSALLVRRLFPDRDFTRHAHDHDGDSYCAICRNDETLRVFTSDEKLLWLTWYRMLLVVGDPTSIVDVRTLVVSGYSNSTGVLTRGQRDTPPTHSSVSLGGYISNKISGLSGSGGSAQRLSAGQTSAPAAQTTKQAMVTSVSASVDAAHVVKEANSSSADVAVGIPPIDERRLTSIPRIFHLTAKTLATISDMFLGLETSATQRFIRYETTTASDTSPTKSTSSTTNTLPPPVASLGVGVTLFIDRCRQTTPWSFESILLSFTGASGAGSGVPSAASSATTKRSKLKVPGLSSSRRQSDKATSAAAQSDAPECTLFYSGTGGGVDSLLAPSPSAVAAGYTAEMTHTLREVFGTRPPVSTVLSLLGPWLLSCAQCRALTADAISEVSKAQTVDTAASPMATVGSCHFGQAEAVAALCRMFACHKANEEADVKFFDLFSVALKKVLSNHLDLAVVRATNSSEFVVTVCVLLLNLNSLLRTNLVLDSNTLFTKLFDFLKLCYEPAATVASATAKSPLALTAPPILKEAFDECYLRLFATLFGILIPQRMQIRLCGEVVMFLSSQKRYSTRNFQLLIVCIQTFAVNVNDLIEIDSEHDGANVDSETGTWLTTHFQRVVSNSLAAIWQHILVCGKDCQHSTLGAEHHRSLPQVVSVFELMTYLCGLGSLLSPIGGESSSASSRSTTSGPSHGNSSNMIYEWCEWIVKLILLECDRPRKEHKRQVHSIIVSAYNCLTALILLQPTLLNYNSDANRAPLFNSLLVVAEIGLTGSGSRVMCQYPTLTTPNCDAAAARDSVGGGDLLNDLNRVVKQPKPLSGRVQNAAERLLWSIVSPPTNDLWRASPNCLPESEGCCLIEADLVAAEEAADSAYGDAEPRSSSAGFTYFIVDDAMLMSIRRLRCRRSEDSDDSAPDVDQYPRAHLIIRDSFGRRAFEVTMPRYGDATLPKVPQVNVRSDNGDVINGDSVEVTLNDSRPRMVDRLPKVDADKQVPDLADYLQNNQEAKRRVELISQLMAQNHEVESEVAQKMYTSVATSDNGSSDCPDKCVYDEPVDEYDTARLLLSTLNYISSDYATEANRDCSANDMRPLSPSQETRREPRLVQLCAESNGQRLSEGIAALDRLSTKLHVNLMAFYARANVTDVDAILANCRPVEKEDGEHLQPAFKRILLSIGWPKKLRHYRRMGNVSFFEKTTASVAQTLLDDSEDEDTSSDGGAEVADEKLCFNGKTHLLYYADACHSLLAMTPTERGAVKPKPPSRVTSPVAGQDASQSSTTSASPLMAFVYAERYDDVPRIDVAKLLAATMGESEAVLTSTPAVVVFVSPLARRGTLMRVSVKCLGSTAVSGAADMGGGLSAPPLVGESLLSENVLAEFVRSAAFNLNRRAALEVSERISTLSPRLAAIRGLKQRFRPLNAIDKPHRVLSSFLVPKAEPEHVREKEGTVEERIVENVKGNEASQTVVIAV